MSGFTFAYGDEPDLDRVIRFNDPVSPRSHAPKVGVKVDEVRLDATVVPAHPLLGARVDLLDDAKEEQRNYALMGYGDTAQPYEAIDPLHIRVSAGPRLSFQRLDILEPDHPGIPLARASVAALTRRGFSGGGDVDGAFFTKVTGFDDIYAYRQARRSLVEREFMRVPPEEKGRAAALYARLQELQDPDTGDRRTKRLGIYGTRSIALAGPTVTADPDRRIGGVPDPVAPWPHTQWLGIFDCDALQMYVQGTLDVPLLPYPA